MKANRSEANEVDEMDFGLDSSAYTEKVPGYTAAILRSNEDMIGRAKFHWVIYLTNSFIWVGLMGLLLGLKLNADKLEYPIVKTILIGVGLAFILLGWMYVKLVKYSTEMVATDHRIIKKTGLIMRDISEIRLDTIESVEVHQPIMGRLLGYGTIVINGVGFHKVEFNRVSNLIEFRNSIYF